MNTKDSFKDRLPYYWDGENIESLLSVLASPLDESSDAIDRLRATRRLTELIDGEEISSGKNLDNLTFNVGVVRDVLSFIDSDLDIDVQAENDEMLRNRAVWNIDLQQSDAISNQIKKLFAQGLVMFRVRTGFGGTVREYDLTASDFTHPRGPKYELPGDDLNREVRDIESSDIFVFQNRETMVGGAATDYEHGKFGNLTNFYQIAIPWKAMPWAEGENDFRWVSEDDWERPQLESFTSSDLSGNVFEFTNELEKAQYPVVSVYNNSGEKVTPDSVTSTSGNIQIDLSSFTVEDGWNIRISGDDGHRRKFTSSELDTGVLTINHNLDFEYPLVAVYDDSGNLVDPDYIKYIDSSTVEIDLSSFTVNNTWHATLAGGTSSRNYHKSFSSEDTTVREIAFPHNLSVPSLNVQIFDNNDKLYDPMLIKHINNDTTYVKFASEGIVTGEWNIQITADGVIPPTSDPHGWDKGVWGAVEQDLVVEPLRELSDLTRPAATQVGIYGYGGMIWRSEDDWEDSSPPEDELHGWGAKWDGDVEEREYFEEEVA